MKKIKAMNLRIYPNGLIIGEGLRFEIIVVHKCNEVNFFIKNKSYDVFISNKMGQ